jgi:hypothetical protein
VPEIRTPADLDKVKLTPCKVLLQICKNHGFFSSLLLTNVFVEIEADRRQENYILVELENPRESQDPKFGSKHIPTYKYF